MIPRGFLCSIPIGLLLLITTAAGEEVLVEPTHVTIESKEGQRLRVVFATEDRPALTLKPKGGAWDWSRESRLIIPVENPSGEALTVRLRVEDQKRRSMTGEVAAFTRVAACTLARSPIRDPLSEGFRHFVSSMPAPVASGWSESPGGPRTHWKAPPCHGAPPFQSFVINASQLGAIRTLSVRVKCLARSRGLW